MFFIPLQKASLVRDERSHPTSDHARRAAAKRSYPTSEVRGSSRECQGATAQERLRGAIPRRRSGAATGRRYPRPKPEARGNGREELPHAPTPEARGGGQEELPHVPTPEARGSGREEQPLARGQGWGPGGPTPRLRPGAASGRNYPTPHAPTPEARGSGQKDQPDIQGAMAAQA